MGFFIKCTPMELILLPFMCGLLAWFIAWFFVKAIFLKWNHQISKHIKSIDIGKLNNSLSVDQQLEATLPFIDAQLDHFFNHKLGEKMPMIAMFIGAQTTTQLKTVFIEELKIVFPQLLTQMSTGIQADLSNHIHGKWKKILEPLLLSATKQYRILAFLIGGLWGFLLYMLIQHS
jgi:hypothetical protein